MKAGAFLDSVLLDLRFAVRSLRKNRGFAITAILTLALGIGATTAIFTVVNGVLLKPPPFPDAERLVGVWTSTAFEDSREVPISASLYVTYREDNRTFEDIGVMGRSLEAVHRATGSCPHF